MTKRSVIRKQRPLFLTASFDSLEDAARFRGGLSALDEQVDYGLMTVRCDADPLARG